MERASPWSYFGHDELGNSPNLIGFWDFNLDPGNNTTIDNVYGMVGELRNGAVFTDDSHEGQAMDFTDGGNQHVHVAAGEFLNIASSVNQISVAFWQKNYSIPSTSSFWAEPGHAMQAHVPWGNGEIYWDTSGCCNGATQRINANATDIGGWGEDMLDTWHHYVFVKNEDVKAIWIDGELFHEGENTAPLPTDIDWINIGGDRNGNNSLRGVIDDFAVFASALDEDQIMALAEGGRSILPVAPGYPTFISASPDTAAADGSAELSVTLYKRADDAQNAQLSVNGQDVDTSVSTDGETITITGTATGLMPGTVTAWVSYNGRSNVWSISVPERVIIEEESFGDPVTYTNIAPTLIGQLSVNGKAAGAGDIVAIYVGEELRGKQEVSIDEEGVFSPTGTAWVNAQVHSAGGQELATFKVYEASTGITFERVAVGAVVIEPDTNVGSFTEPLLIRADNVAPAIVLLGDMEMTITVGSEYEEAGAIATDNVDGDVTGHIVVNGMVDVTQAGVYTLIYSVSDEVGNTATATRTVAVEKIPALLRLSGFDQTYDGSAKELNATAVDSADNELEVEIVMVYRDAAGEIVASATNAGTYTVTATIDDDKYAGTATATLTIEKAEAVVMISDTIQTYDGEEKRVIVTTRACWAGCVEQLQCFRNGTDGSG